MNASVPMHRDEGLTQHITLTVDSLAYGGDGIARAEDGKVVFVRGAAPGDVVHCEVTQEKKGFSRANVIKVVDPSPARVTPPCPYAAVCGGCQWQHIGYEAQLTWKRRAVTDALARIGSMRDDAADPVSPIVPSKKTLHYRNKVEFKTVRTDEGRFSLGFSALSSTTIQPIDSCLLLPKKYVGAPASIRGTLRYLEGSGDLGIARVGLRASTKTSSSELALWTHPGPFPRAHASKTFSSSIPLTSLTRVMYKGELKKRAVSKVEVIAGEGSWREQLGTFSYRVSSPSFFQVNTASAKALVDHVLAITEVDEGTRVLDLYAGVGTFTLPLAAHVKEVCAIEAEGSSVRDLRRNLEANGLFADVRGGDVARELATLSGFDLVLVDPPRSGLAPGVAARIGEVGANTVVYISCDPSTLARDIQAFSAEGYVLASVTPFDLFPQTYHVETVALLKRQNA